QGFVAGPMIPLSQSLLLSSYPRALAGLAMGMWAITTLVAPVTGPLLGGWITDHVNWPWIFYINIPVGIIAALSSWAIYHKRETITHKLPIDRVGLALLVVWIGALQIMLDVGKEHNWFSSGLVIGLAVTAVVGFAFFLAWELTDQHPVVDLRLFKLRNFWTGTVSTAVGYGLFFGNLVLLPLWLQQYMGYTATDSGMILAPVGLFAIILSPILGIAMAFFFIPLVTITLSGLPPDRIPAASGLTNFARITAGAFGTSISTTLWESRAALHHSQLAEAVNAGSPAAQAALSGLAAGGLTPEQALGQINRMVDQQAFMLAANDIFYISAVLFLALIPLVWLSHPIPAHGSGG